MDQNMDLQHEHFLLGPTILGGCGSICSDSCSKKG